MVELVDETHIGAACLGPRPVAEAVHRAAGVADLAGIDTYDG